VRVAVKGEPQGTVRTRVYKDLKEDIITCKLRPGDPVGEVELARTHRSSRTPVREALNMLERDGLILSIPHRGYFITEVSIRKVQDFFEVRALLESHCAELAAGARRPEDVAELQRLARACIVGGRKDTFRQALAQNRRFHLKLAECSRNQYLVDVLSDLFDQIARVQYLELDAMPAGAMVATEEHLDILEAIQRGDAPAARELMNTHVRSSLRALLDRVFQR